MPFTKNLPFLCKRSHVSSLDVRQISNFIKSPCKSGSFCNAHKVFDEIPERNVVSWTSRISMQAQKGLNDRALTYFLHMQTLGIEPNETTFSTVIRICCLSGRINLGFSLHCLILKKGFIEQAFVASGLIALYSKCNYIEDASRVFDLMRERGDAVVWNSMIAAYMHNGLNGEAISLFLLMLDYDLGRQLLVNNFTFSSVFKATAGLGCNRIGKSLHSYAIILGFDGDLFVAGSIIDMYSKCGSLDIARNIFDRMGKRDLVVWNAMITGYAQNVYNEEAIKLFYQLQYQGFLPNGTTFASILKALSGIADIVIGRCFHAKIIKSGCSLDLFVGTALVDMYSKCLDMEDAEISFMEMERKNLVSFNALITGYSVTGKYKDALKAYADLRRNNMRPDPFTFTGILSSCSMLGALDEGTQVHTQSIKFGFDSNVSVGNSLVNLYAKSSSMDSASKAFNSITTPNNISWAGIISGFTQNGEGEMALKYFCKMHKLSERPDEFSFSSILKTISSWAAMEQGKHIHAHIIKSGLESTIFVGSTLVDVYSKSGMPEDSFKVFRNMPEKNVVSWNSMITGYAQNGLSEKSLCLFTDMKCSGMKPNCITFIAVLFACSHAGLVDEGRYYYDEMVFTYGITPILEHCTCMVDLLGRAGYLNEAETFLINSAFSSEPAIWRSLLSACRVHKNMEMGIRAAEICLQIEPNESSTYVLLSNMYASKCLWCEASRVRNLMRENCVEKEVGCSWIEVRNTVHVFGADDRSQSLNERIIMALEKLMVHLKMAGYVHKASYVLHDVADA